MKFALVGGNIKHSLSPHIHTLLFQKHGVKASYELLEVQSVAGVKEALLSGQFQGYNITIPFKAQFLDVNLSPTAMAMQAVNVLYAKNGSVYGDNTDGEGFLAALQYADFPSSWKSVNILGYGGAARAAGFVLKKQRVDVSYFSRSSVDKKDVFNIADLENYKADLLVNATPLGMPPLQEALPAKSSILKSYDFIMDMSYSLSDTVLHRFCKKENIAFANGLHMLIAQAILAQEIWVQQKYPLYEDMQFVLKNLRSIICAY